MWNERFDKPEYVFGTEPADFLVAHQGLLGAGMRALVIADGEGRNSVFLAECGVDVVAMDSSPVGIAKARELAERRGVTVDFTEANLLSWTWEPDAYDLVVGIFFQFVGPDDRPAVFAGLHKTVRPGGRLLLHGYTPKQLEYGTGGPRVLDQLWTPDLLQEAFATMDIERLESYEAELSEGTGHVGQSALVDLIARKR